MTVAAIHIGITGTRHGATDKQLEQLEQELENSFHPGYHLHHGDCVGVDAQAHEIAQRIGYLIEIHPPVDRTLRAFCAADIKHPPRGYLDRNRDIVIASHKIYVVPSGPEELQSGTWATYRMAKRLNVPHFVISP